MATCTGFVASAKSPEFGQKVRDKSVYIFMSKSPEIVRKFHEMSVIQPQCPQIFDIKGLTVQTRHVRWLEQTFRW